MSWRRPPERKQADDWKPTVCEHDGCDQPHPSHSVTGGQGPWFCQAHFYAAREAKPASSEPEKMNRAAQPGLF